MQLFPWLNVFLWFSAIFWFVQMLGAFLYRRRLNRTRVPLPLDTRVDVVVPVFNEPPETLRRTLESLGACERVNRIIVVDDGSSPPLQPVPGVQWITLEKNMGKREALVRGYEACVGEWVACVDSDTRVDPMAFTRLLETAVSGGCGAVTGNVRLSNSRKNPLTRMIEVLYWFSFEQERCMQALVGSVCCMSGALYVIRRDIVLRNRESFLDQRVFGCRTRAGDDRHLTSLCLLEGCRVAVDPGALAYTETPYTPRTFAVQQVRWVRSYTRELVWLAPRASRLPAAYGYVVFTDAYRYLYICVFTLLLPLAPLEALLGMLVSGALHGLVGTLYTRRPSMIWWSMLFSLYGMVAVTPFLLYALVTPHRDKWMSRESGHVRTCPEEGTESSLGPGRK